MLNITPIERALILARSGDVVSIGELRKRLAHEGYNYAQIAGALDGWTIKRQLRQIISAAREPAERGQP